MKQKESYHGLELPAPLGNMVTMVPPPPLLSKIMPKHDKDGGDIGKKIIDGQLGLVHVDSTQRSIKKHIH